MSQPNQPDGSVPGAPGAPGAPAQQVVYVEKPKKPFYKRLGCMIPLGLVAVVVIAVAVNGGSKDSTPSTTAGNKSDSSASEPAAIGDTVHMKKADVTLSGVREQTDPLGGNQICADVSFVNTSDKDKLTLNGLTDWEAQDPNGVSRSLALGGSDYDAVDIAPGGSKDGVVCFDSDGLSGDYTFTFKEGLSFSNDSAQWKASL